MAGESQMDGTSPSPQRSRIRRLIRVGLLVAVGVGVILQFVPVKGIGHNPPGRHKVDAPPDVEAVLRKSCFDCHSNETQWPFYARIAPSSWLMARDVNKGRARLNMSDWGEVDEEERAIDRKDMWEQVEAGEMPPWFYLPLHPSARLSDSERALLKNWMMAEKKTP